MSTDLDKLAEEIVVMSLMLDVNCITSKATYEADGQDHPSRCPRSSVMISLQLVCNHGNHSVLLDQHENLHEALTAFTST